MKRSMKFVFILISILPGVFTNSKCSINMCLRWTSRPDILKIICKIDELYFPVYIHNNVGVEIARCSIPFPLPLCTPSANNTIVDQNVNTNETIVRVKGRIDQSINGNWSCRHGYGRTKYEANIEINIPKFKEQTKSSEKDDFRCLKEIALYTMTGVVISVVMFSFFWFLKCQCKFAENRRERLIVLTEDIDTCFEFKRCKKYSVNKIKIVFFIIFVLLMLLAGILIGVVEKDSCSGSVAFIFLGIILCLALLILFIRNKDTAANHRNGTEEASNSSANEEVFPMAVDNINDVVHEGPNGRRWKLCC